MNYQENNTQAKLIRFLISEGYIDDHYCDYISYFYSNSITSSDKCFAMVVSGNEPSLSYDYKLISIKNILYYFDNNDFKKEQILNIDLLDYLLNNQSKYQNQIDIFFDVIIKNNKRDFIKEYCAEKKNTIPQLIKKTNSVWPNMFADAVSEEEEETFLKLFSIYTLCYCDTETIKSVNKENCLGSFISENESYLEFETAKPEKYIEGFKLLDIKFKSISIKANEALVDEVYKNNLYVLNPQNLLYMYNRYSGVDLDIIVLPTYTILKNNTHLEQLCSCVSNNIAEYISILLEENNVIYDNAAGATFILNSGEISSETKKAYIEKLDMCVFNPNPDESKIDKISRIQIIKDTTLWHDLVEKDFVKNSVNNIVRFFLSSHKVDSSLIKLINECTTFDLKNAEFTDQEKEEFASAIVACNSIHDSIYKQIMESEFFSIKDFKYENINSLKMDTLSKNSIILMNEKNLKFIREHYDYNSLIQFIKRNIDQYIKQVEYNSNLFSTSEVFDLLDSSSIGNQQKTKLISLIKNFKDLETLAEKYNQYDDEIKTSIKHALINAIIDNDDTYISIKLPKSIFYDMLTEDDDISVNILVSQVKHMNYDEIKYALKNTQFEDHNKFIEVFDKKKHPKFTVNENNRKLLETFKEQGIIKSYKNLASGKYSVQRSL